MSSPRFLENDKKYLDSIKILNDISSLFFETLIDNPEGYSEEYERDVQAREIFNFYKIELRKISVDWSLD